MSRESSPIPSHPASDTLNDTQSPRNDTATANNNTTTYFRNPHSPNSQKQPPFPRVHLTYRPAALRCGPGSGAGRERPQAQEEGAARAIGRVAAASAAM
ncbi:hypothetical protein Dsin_005839 [Dipteronia sinensis]|uniref:Uncharacterized protein n=1 Tax=Dipteronia sinensis TaxID=43782 RepID=A0AAE0AXK3_9ROSI|nr:hypothetical protein Dsin_005839 [Dipteronia sinensis]